MWHGVMVDRRDHRQRLDRFLKKGFRNKSGHLKPPQKKDKRRLKEHAVTYITQECDSNQWQHLTTKRVRHTAFLSFPCGSLLRLRDDGQVSAAEQIRGPQFV